MERGSLAIKRPFFNFSELGDGTSSGLHTESQASHFQAAQTKPAEEPVALLLI
jgi:hypothetical protein